TVYYKEFKVASILAWSTIKNCLEPIFSRNRNQLRIRNNEAAVFRRFCVQPNMIQ
ncbi:MAG: hypothetical protein FD143_3587, partial [Ignavibacteria bacterium]